MSKTQKNFPTSIMNPTYGTSNTYMTSNGKVTSPSPNIKYKLKIDANGDNEEEFDIRSIVLLLKTMLSKNGYDENLIYMEYDDLFKLLSRDSNIEKILGE